MSRFLAVLLLGTLTATFGCGKTETAQAPAADIPAAPGAAPGEEKAGEPAKVEPASAQKPADGPATGDKPAGEAQPTDKPEEKPAEPKSTTDARPTVLLKLLAKPMTDAMDDLTKSLPAPQMGGGR